MNSSLFIVASTNPTLGKSAQLELWLIFQELLKELDSLKLEFNRKDLEILKSTASQDQLKMIQSALTAKDRLVHSNQALVIKLAEQYSNSALTKAELIQQGNLGLMRAMVKFIPKKNAKFSSYAYFWIKALIFEALYQIDPIYIPPRVKKEMKQSYSYVSLDKESRTWEVADHSDRSTVDEVMLSLNEREREVLKLGFNLDGTGGSLSLALALGCSLESAQQEMDATITKAKILSKI
jgi:RNA polymerase sigma factor (sigma-70 family)